MGENTKIEWPHHTFNPWIGCTKVSEGCKHCYAEAMMDKRYGRVEWGPEGKRVRTSAAYWKQPLAWNRKAEKAEKRARVLCASLADVFESRLDINGELDEWRTDLWDLVQETPWLDWLFLTKRPENVLQFVPLSWWKDTWDWFKGWPDNVWIGTSVENQAQANKRIPKLLEIPARVRFLSMEPLLGPVDFRLVPGFNRAGSAGQEAIRTFWVIVGGESGANARPMHPDWVLSLRDQCQNAGVPFFFKQWGEWAKWIPILGNPKKLPVQHVMLNGSDYFPGNYTSSLSSMIRVGKKAAGRLLDGREWNEFPVLERSRG